MAANPENGESALIVAVDVPVALKRLRDGLDPSAAAGVPAHITLLYPFVPPALLDEGVRERVAVIVGAEPAFAFVLKSVGRWPHVVYLAPEPADPFRRLIRALAAEFPDYLPYGGERPLEDVKPHLTIVESERADYLDAAAHALPSLLPVRAVCREAWLISHVGGARWRKTWSVPLGDRGLQ